MQTLFELEKRPDIDAEQSLLRNAEELGETDVDFGKDLVHGVVNNTDALREAIQKHAPDWSLERMDPISRSVLFVGAFELAIQKEAPPAVVMNEAIEIAKEFSSEESGKFVNGVLNALAKGVQA